ncbi:MAG: hypothetical protein LBI56_02100 [Puniceicoccales bacterium]|jgi:hypothetical protein|nr:hypothetical protein [Puniceicoccales bacterium]
MKKVNLRNNHASPISSERSDEVEKKIALEEKELELYSRLHIPFVDPKERAKYSEEYNSRALAPMLAWVKKRARNSKSLVQYQEVFDELKKFSPKYFCDLVFAKNVLLLKIANSLPNLPKSLPVVLNTLHLMRPEGMSLVKVEEQASDLLFTVEFDFKNNGRIVTNSCFYKLHNYLHPTSTALEPLEILQQTHSK